MCIVEKTTLDTSLAQATTKNASVNPVSSPSAPPANAEVSNKVSSPDVTAAIRVDKPVSVDSVSISSEAFRVASDAKTEEAKKAEAKEDILADVSKKNNLKLKAASAGVQFIYNQKGDLITKYLDLSGELIYQVPSKLLLLLRELEPKSNSSVDVNA
jgi:uncharacterized FlaG/YvyC family protein